MGKLVRAGSRGRKQSAALIVEQLEDRAVPSITYHGGPVLAHVEAEGVYYGSYWGQGAGAQQGSDLNTYLQFITNSSYMDMLSEYGVGRGTLVDNGIADPGISAGQTVDDSQIRQMLLTNIGQGFLQAPDANRLYIVFTPPNVIVTSGSQSSARDFFGYHDSFISPSLRVIRYAVIVHPIGNGDAQGLSDFQTLTWVASHELAESATNPDNGGWFDSRTNDEIADLCNSVNDAGVLNGYVITGVWSVRQNACVIPGDAQFLTPGTSGMPSFQLRNQVSIAFLTSDEYHADIVENYYLQFLGRTPSSGEVSGWVTTMSLGMTDEQVIADVVESNEYYQRAGVTDRAWIDALYHDLLGRKPATAEENAWLQALAGGLNREAVAFDIADSVERETRVIAADYQTYLGRAVNASELANWIGVFQQGFSNEHIIAAFVSSDEFYFGQGGTIESWLTGLYQAVLGRAPDKAGFAEWDAFVHNGVS
jgi:hypothetical protein